MVSARIHRARESFDMSRSRAVATLVLATALLSLGSPATAERINPGHQMSWGKGGVSLEQYWADSTACAQAAADVDLEGSKPARALQFWTRLGNGDMPPNNYADILMSVRINPEVQWNRAATILRSELESCLVERGYVKFELTDEQDAMLRTLEQGSDERRAYLHSLASDPVVLAAQMISQS
jgi:hypothetical protein